MDNLQKKFEAIGLPANVDSLPPELAKLQQRIIKIRGFGLSRGALEIMHERNSGGDSLRESVREGANAVIENGTFEKTQKLATYGSIFGEPLVTGAVTALKTQFPEINADYPWSQEETAQFFRLGFAGVFGANLSMRLAAAKEWQDLKDPEVIIDTISILAEAFENLPIGNARVARLVKSMKGARQVAKLLRTQKIGSIDNSLEDIVMTKISKRFTWTIMALLAGFPVVGSFDDFDYTKLEDVAKDVGFSLGMIWLSKSFLDGVREDINEDYTQLLERSKGRIYEKLTEHPELAFLKDRFNTGENEVLLIVEGLLETLVNFKETINPVGEDLQLDENGNIQSKDIEAAVMMTDLRNFTMLSEELEGDIFSFLKLNYFSHIKALIKKYNGRILNHTGDGLVTYFVDEVDAQGKVVKTKEAISIECMQELNELTNDMNEIWLEHLDREPGQGHLTGTAVSTGTIRVGDALSLSRTGGANMTLAVQTDFMQLAETKWADLIASEEVVDINRVVGIGTPINWSARLESLTKKNEDYNCLIPAKTYDQLPPELQEKFVYMDDVELKGIEGRVEIYAMRRHKKAA